MFSSRLSESAEDGGKWGLVDSPNDCTGLSCSCNVIRYVVEFRHLTSIHHVPNVSGEAPCSLFPG